MTVRPIRPEDVPAVVALVRELADYEKALHEARLTEDQLTGALFGDSPALFGHVAEHEGQVVGMPSPGAAGVVLASVFAFGDQMQGRDRLWVLLPVVVPALLMVSNIRFRSFRSLVSPKSGRPYGLIAMAVVLVVGFALIPAITGIAVAYGYLLAPLLLPVVAPLSRLLPAKLKEMLS